MKKTLFNILKILVAFYLIVCGLLYVFQEQLIFFPQNLEMDYQFKFEPNFEEVFIETTDEILLHGLLFKAETSRGLIFYLHGNAGSLKSWGEVAKTYTDLNQDVFMLDYRGYGKSEGSISGQKQFFQDIQTTYDEMKKRYNEENIVVLGYSIGTGPAAKIASTNNPGLLILQAPYYSLKDMMRRTYPMIPTTILKYKFETNEYIKDCEMPVVIFHGNQDDVVYYGSSIKLKEHFKEPDTLITLTGQGHNNMSDNEEYKTAIKQLLSDKIKRTADND